jgi:cellulose-binding protein
MSWMLLLWLTGPLACAATPESDTFAKPRLIVLTDIGNEPDDSESMVRLMLYSSDIEIDGLIAATSHHLPNGTHQEMIEHRVDAYEQALVNLREHDSRYPPASALRAVIRSGSQVYGMLGVGRGKGTEASRLIIAAVDKSDPRPVRIAIWGGGADLGQALWTVRANRSTAAVKEFVAKLRVYSISDQDDAEPWTRANFPELFWVTSIHGFLQYPLATWYGISGALPGADPAPVSKEWLANNIQSKGVLGKLYPTPAYLMEGDTPSFLFVIPNGLNNPERPDWGGWGGRYSQITNELGLWTTTMDAVQGIDGATYTTQQASVWRWRREFQDDFAARMLWSVTPTFKGANHRPVAVLNSRAGLEPVEINGCPGEAITLSATGSSDPDQDPLTYKWWWYREAGGIFAPEVTLSTNSGETVTATVGGAAHVDQFAPPAAYNLHIILEVSDNGTPRLTSYRRAIVKVPGSSTASDKKSCSIRPIPPSHPPATQ